MPNLWTKTTQNIIEAFSGPRTKDIEFDRKVEEMKKIEKAIIILKSAFQNVVNSTLSLKNLCREVYGCIRSIYDKNTPYHEIAVDIFETHVEIEKQFENFLKSVNNIHLRTSEWSQMFAITKPLLQQREEKRKHFDHYDEKLEKLYKAKLDRIRRKVSESSKDIELLERNELKYKKATEEYIKHSLNCYTIISSIMENRYKVVNPVVAKFVADEKYFFDNASNLFKKFHKIEDQFTQIFKSQPEMKVTYDPCKYIRGGKIVKSDKEIKEENNNYESERKNSNVKHEGIQADKNGPKSAYIKDRESGKSLPKSGHTNDHLKSNDLNKQKQNQPKYNISEFKSLDDFLKQASMESIDNHNNSPNEKSSQDASMAKKNWNIRLSSVENFEKIENNFSSRKSNLNSVNQFTLGQNSNNNTQSQKPSNIINLLEFTENNTSNGFNSYNRNNDLGDYSNILQSNIAGDPSAAIGFFPSSNTNNSLHQKNHFNLGVTDVEKNNTTNESNNLKRSSNYVFPNNQQQMENQNMNTVYSNNQVIYSNLYSDITQVSNDSTNLPINKSGNNATMRNVSSINNFNAHNNNETGNLTFNNNYTFHQNIPHQQIFNQSINNGTNVINAANNSNIYQKQMASNYNNAVINNYSINANNYNSEYSQQLINNNNNSLFPQENLNNIPPGIKSNQLVSNDDIFRDFFY